MREELTKAQKARLAIRIVKTTADALSLRGYYKPSGASGKTLADALKMFSPEIYGSMNDPRIIELKGLEYVIDRLPRGIERCTKIVLTAQEDLDDTSFEKFEPLKRRRTSYRIGEKEMCFVITRGLSEIYDILTHLTFMNIEAGKIRKHMTTSEGGYTREWKELEKILENGVQSDNGKLDRAIWYLSIILGRTYHETRQCYDYLEKNKREHQSNEGLFQIIYNLGKRVEEEEKSSDDEVLISFTPSLQEMIGHHKYAADWAVNIKKTLKKMGLQNRPLHIISANLHSVLNLLYGYACLKSKHPPQKGKNIYDFFTLIRDRVEDVLTYAQRYGLLQIPDTSGANIDCQVIDTALLEDVTVHPDLDIDFSKSEAPKPVLLIMDYAFGTQAFEVMDELLSPYHFEKSQGKNDKTATLNVQSISIMGKAGILPGKKGDIMLATAHVLEGTADNYIVDNDLKTEDFDESIDVYMGPIVTVLGTSLQNRDVLEKFQTTSWKAVGLEMEGGHYQRAISAAIIRGHISKDVKVRYAYYASDNPLISGQTLAQGPMGMEGIKPTYMVTKVIIEKILKG